MAGKIQHLPTELGRLHHIALAHPAVGRRTDDGHAKRLKFHIGAGIAEQLRFILPGNQRCVRKRRFQGRVAGDVIGVAMRVERWLRP